MKTVRFHFDFLSPYAYLAWLKLQDLGAAIEPVPTLLAALLAHHGHKGPAEIEPKRIWTFKHISRLAHDHGVVVRPPPVHPFNPLLPLRIATAAPETIGALYDRVWRDGQPIDTAEALKGVISDALIAKAQTQPIKDALKKNTEDAINKGCFGVPTMFVDDELFWGFDALPHLKRYLDGKDPLIPAEMERWKNAVTFGVRR